MPVRRFPSAWVLARLARERDEERAQATRAREAVRDARRVREGLYPPVPLEGRAAPIDPPIERKL